MIVAGEFDGQSKYDAVLDIAEAAAHVAHLIGRRFSVVTTLARSIAPIEDRLMLAGLAAHCASVRACGLGTAEVDADTAGAVAAIVDEAAKVAAAVALAQALVGLGLSTSKAGGYAPGPDNPRSHWPLSTALGLGP